MIGRSALSRLRARVPSGETLPPTSDRPLREAAPGSTHGESFLTAAAAAWNRSPSFLLALWAVPVAILGGGFASALLGKAAFKWYTGEDQFAETLQVFCYAVALGFCLLSAQPLWRSGRKVLALLYLVVGAGLVCMIGEEVSWGQRLFGWQTPESLREINLQQETTLHNIRGVATGVKWMEWLAGAYGTILPLWMWRADHSRRVPEWISFVVPHVTLVPFFAPLFLWRCYRNFFPEPARHRFFVSEFNEVLELALAAGVLFFMVYQWQRLRGARAAVQPKKR
jgi:hypothetical protein